MCRLMLMNTAWIQMIEEVELQGLFKTLNDKNGGHGIGVAFCYDKNDPVIHKGVNLDPVEMGSLVYGEKDNPDLRYVIYHARLASAAMIDDTMCHPFSEQKLFGLTMAHNGHVRQFAESSTHSDTAIIFNLITQYGLPVDFVADLSGVFIGVHKKIPFVIKASTYSELDLAYTPDYNAFCFCSNFYHYTEKFRKRFIIEESLNNFVWSKRLNAKEINKMYKPNDDYYWKDYSYSNNRKQKAVTPTHTVVEKYPKNRKYTTDAFTVDDYGQIKTRNIGGVVTYHAQHCDDWYVCQGECLTLEE